MRGSSPDKLTGRLVSQEGAVGLAEVTAIGTVWKKHIVEDQRYAGFAELLNKACSQRLDLSLRPPFAAQLDRTGSFLQEKEGL